MYGSAPPVRLYLVWGLASALLVCASAQSYGPFEGAPPGRPVSARLDQLTAMDPTGRQALLSALGKPVPYIGQWPYQFDPSMVDATPSVDPAVVSPVPGNDPRVNGTFHVAGTTGAIAAHVIPFANDLVLELIRPNPRINFGGETSSFSNESYLLQQTSTGPRMETAALYNLSDNTFVPFHITESPLCSGHLLTTDGKAIIAGGMMVGINAPYYTIGYQAVRLVDGINQSYSLVNEMPTGRWYPSLVTLPDGEIAIVGGAQIEMIGWGTSMSPLGMGTPAQGSSTSTVQCSGTGGNQPSDPSYGTPTYAIMSQADYSLSRQLTLTILMESWPINTYPFLFVLPTGSVLVIAGTQMEALFLEPEGAEPDDEVGQLPQLPVPVMFPQQGTAALLPLEGPNYDAQVLIAGGSSEYCATAQSPAGSTSWLIDLSPGHNHSLVEEQLHYGRVMGDLVLLPDGRAFLCNGAQMGIAGGSGYGFSAANDGATVPEIYDPSAPIGQRWSIAADSQIWRMYHSTAFLTSNATVFVGGSEVTSEYRSQIYTPNYFYTGRPRPVIDSVPSNMGFDASFSIAFSGVGSIDRVVLNRLASATHGNHFDQRQVVLDCSPSGQQQQACMSPPNAYIAPPGQYQLFIHSEGFPSQAKIVTVGPSSSQASAPTSIDGNQGSAMPVLSAPNTIDNITASQAG